MRRLIAWTLTPISIFSLLLVSLRGSDLAACVRLQESFTGLGSVLTVDVNAQQSHLDSRTTYPIITNESNLGYVAPVSPDKRYVLETVNVPESGSSLGDLVAGPRGVGDRYLRQLNGDTPVGEYTWSPASTHIAFTEMVIWQGSYKRANLVVANVATYDIQRELIPDGVDDDWFQSYHAFKWSPDGSVFAIPMLNSQVGATLLIRSIAASQTHYLALPGERIGDVNWSPDGAVGVVTASEMAAKPRFFKLYFINPLGGVIKEITLPSDYVPSFGNNNRFGIFAKYWSPDGQYVLMSDDYHHTDIFNRNGERINFTFPTTQERFWSALPHTLIYLTDKDAPQAFYALDAATGQSTPLVPNMTPRTLTNLDWWTFPDESGFVIAEQGTHGGSLLHFIPLDLSINATPFGEIKLGDYSFASWSPDQRNITVVDEHPTDYVITWWRKDTGTVQRYRLAKRGVDKEQVKADWLTNDIMLIKGSEGVTHTQTLYLLNTQTLQLIPLLPEIVGAESNYITAVNDSLLKLSTPTGHAFLSMQDGRVLLSVPLPTDYPGWNPYPDPAVQAVLMHGERTIFLATATTMDKITEATSTAPVWSPDGSRFVYGQRDIDGWTLHIMSRDGKPLKTFSIQRDRFGPHWEQLRWTKCD